jgi:hypothetical protein
MWCLAAAVCVRVCSNAVCELVMLSLLRCIPTLCSALHGCTLHTCSGSRQVSMSAYTHTRTHTPLHVHRWQQGTRSGGDDHQGRWWWLRLTHAHTHTRAHTHKCVHRWRQGARSGGDDPQGRWWWLRLSEPAQAAVHEAEQAKDQVRRAAPR